MQKPGLVIFCVVWLLVQTPDSISADFMVDIGVADPVGSTGASPNDIQSAFFDFSVPQQFSSSGIRDFSNVGLSPVSRTIAGTLVTITAPQVNGAVYEDNVPDVVHAMGDLIEDGIRTVQSDITIRLSNLPAGSYDVTTWHHMASATATTNAFNILVDAGNGLQIVATGVQTSFGTNPSAVTSQTFNVTSLGTSDILIVLDGSIEQNISPYLNGFSVVTVAAVPEPNAVTCFLTVFVGSWLCRRRKP